MRRGLMILTVALLALLAGSAGGALALSVDPGRPEMIVGADTMTGNLEGNGGGSFAYYALDYPGDGRVVTIRVQFTPADPAMMLGVGFNVYGPDGSSIGNGQPAGGPGVLELQYADTNRARWLIQVYNYLPNTWVAYTLNIWGLPLPPTTPVAGAIAGNRAGAFAYYEIEYPGDGLEVELELDFSPRDLWSDQAVGFNVYGPNGTLVGSGEVAGDPKVKRLRVASAERARWLVQIYNYWDGETVSYSFMAKGLSGIPTAVPATSGG